MTVVSTWPLRITRGVRVAWSIATPRRSSHSKPMTPAIARSGVDSASTTWAAALSIVQDPVSSDRVPAPRLRAIPSSPISG